MAVMPVPLMPFCVVMLCLSGAVMPVLMLLFCIL